jgi:ADP-ribose pyrophosphatase
LPPKKWEVISSKIEGDYRIFNLRIDRSVSPRTKRSHDFYVLESADWVNVIPLTARNEVVLVRQYRHGIRGLALEIPGGIVEKGDSPEAAARRELMEETGYRDSAMVSLGLCHPNPAFLNNRCHMFLAKDVYPAGEQNQDEKEDIEVLLRPLDEIPNLIRNGGITHSLVVAAFYRLYMEHLPGCPFR